MQKAAVIAIIMSSSMDFKIFLAFNLFLAILIPEIQINGMNSWQVDIRHYFKSVCIYIIDSKQTL